MKHYSIKWVLTLIILFSGVFFVEASNQPKHDAWISVKDRQEHIELLFPQPPAHLYFDIPIEKSDEMGHLDVYSSPTKQGLFMLSSLYSPKFNGSEIQPQEFQQIFYSFIIKRMFYSPKIFRDFQDFEYVETSVNEHPALRFSFSYQDHQTPKQLAGIAILKDKKLYTLFYLSAKSNFREDLLENFIDSLHFTDDDSK